MKAVIDKLNALQEDFNKADKEEKDLAADYKDCEKKLANATKLIEGLSSEKQAWQEKSVFYREKL